MLRYEDGTKFIGSGHWGGTKSKVLYYYNREHGIRAKADNIEDEAFRIVNVLADKSNELKEAITNYKKDKSETIKSVQSEIENANEKLLDLDKEDSKLDKRLNFLLEDDDLDMAKAHAGVGGVGFDQFVIHDFRRYRNVISDCIYNMSLGQRSQQLGNSERINATHYTGEVSYELLKTQGQIQGLTAKNLELAAQVKQLLEENENLKRNAI